MKALIALAVSLPLVAQAAPCPTQMDVAAVVASGFSCSEGDKTFADFTVTDAPMGANVLFEPTGAKTFLLSLSRDGNLFEPGKVQFDYTVTATGATITQGTVGVDVPTISPDVVTVSSMNGMVLEPKTLINGGTASIEFHPPVQSVMVTNSSVVLNGDVLTSISNTFTQTPVGVSEPSSLSLLALGLGAILIKRRKGVRT